MKNLVLAASMLICCGAASAASFDCSKASTKVERMICATPVLSALDEELAAAFKARLAQDPGSAASITRDQRLWLAMARGACTTVECTEQAYRRRISGLKFALGPLTPAPPLALPTSPARTDPKQTASTPQAAPTPNAMKTQHALTALTATPEDFLECDRLAAHPDDWEKPYTVKGVPDDSLSLAQALKAIPACSKAAASRKPRYMFQLARAFIFADQNATTLSWLIDAADQGHGASVAYLADFVLYGIGGVRSDPEGASSVYGVAGDLDFLPAYDVEFELIKRLQVTQLTAGRARPGAKQVSGPDGTVFEVPDQGAISKKAKLIAGTSASLPRATKSHLDLITLKIEGIKDQRAAERLAAVQARRLDDEKNETDGAALTALLQAVQVVDADLTRLPLVTGIAGSKIAEILTPRGYAAATDKTGQIFWTKSFPGGLTGALRLTSSNPVKEVVLSDQVHNGTYLVNADDQTFAVSNETTARVPKGWGTR